MFASVHLSSTGHVTHFVLEIKVFSFCLFAIRFKISKCL